MAIIGPDLHTRESQLAINADDGTITDRRIIAAQITRAATPRHSAHRNTPSCRAAKHRPSEPKQGVPYAAGLHDADFVAVPLHVPSLAERSERAILPERSGHLGSADLADAGRCIGLGQRTRESCDSSRRRREAHDPDTRQARWWRSRRAAVIEHPPHLGGRAAGRRHFAPALPPGHWRQCPRVSEIRRLKLRKRATGLRQDKQDDLLVRDASRCRHRPDHRPDHLCGTCLISRPAG